MCFAKETKVESNWPAWAGDLNRGRGQKRELLGRGQLNNSYYGADHQGEGRVHRVGQEEGEELKSGQ